MTVKEISPKEAAELKDAIIVDIREPSELREVIPGAISCPLSEIEQGKLRKFSKDDTVVFSCMLGRRTLLKEVELEQAAAPAHKLYRIEGGINGWKAAGLKVEDGPCV